MMSELLQIARQDLLDPAGLTDTQLQTILSSTLGHSVDNADLYFQSTYSESWALEDGIIKSGSYSIDRGVGVRVMSGEKTGFAYSDDILVPALEQAAQAARSISRQGEDKSIQAWRFVKGRELYLPVNPFISFNEQDKVGLLQRIDAFTRQLDPRVIQVNASLSAEYEKILVMGSDGDCAADVRPLVRLNVSVIVEQNGRREHGYAGGGGRFDYQYFLENDQAFSYAREAVR